MKDIEETAFSYDDAIDQVLDAIAKSVQKIRSHGQLGQDALENINKFFRIKQIHHSNAIEGNKLTYGETRLVVEQGLTISGKSLKDTVEAKNLSHALDFLDDLARSAAPVTELDVRSIHQMILSTIDDGIAGQYRHVDVEISGSRFRPPSHIDVPAKMAEFGRWLAMVTQPENPWTARYGPIIAAAVAHTWFVIVHPFADGNGRTARILMNLLLMRSGIPIAVITTEDRIRYYEALEEAQSTDLSAFLMLLGESVEETIDEYEHAVGQQAVRQEWAASLVSRLNQDEQRKQEVEFDVWRNAFGLLKGLFAEIAETMNSIQAVPLGRISIIDYSEPDLEKYIVLKQGRAAKKNWFFGIQIQSGERRHRFVFWLTRPSQSILLKVMTKAPTLSISISDGARYHRLDQLPDGHPLLGHPDLLVEIAYSRQDEMFVVRNVGGTVESMKADKFVMAFYEKVILTLF